DQPADGCQLAASADDGERAADRGARWRLDLCAVTVARADSQRSPAVTKEKSFAKKPGEARAKRRRTAVAFEKYLKSGSGRAFSALEAAYGERSHWLVWLKRDPRWDEIREQPRFRELVRRAGLPS